MRIVARVPRTLPVPLRAVTSSGSFHTLMPQRRLSAPEARTLLGSAWTTVTGNPPEPRTSALLTAHWALETDAGRSMPGHNFAGIKATPTAAGKTMRTIEGHGATRRELNARFRVYENAEAGAQDYVKLLATRYPDALAAARTGDSAGFARALARGGYFTADPGCYAAGLEQRLAALEPGAPQSPFGSSAPPPALARAALEGVLHALRITSDND